MTSSLNRGCAELLPRGCHRSRYCATKFESQPKGGRSAPVKFHGLDGFMQTHITAKVAAVVVMLTAALSKPAIADERIIRLGQVGLSFYAVVGGIVQEVLEKD